MSSTDLVAPGAQDEEEPPRDEAPAPEAEPQVQLRLPTLDGQRFDQIVWTFSGSLKDEIRTAQDADDVKRAKLDTHHDLAIKVVVASKKWAVSYDKEGVPTRTLSVTLAVDSFEFDA